MNTNKITLTIRTNPELRQITEKYAEDHGISLSAVVNIALSEKLKNLNKDVKQCQTC